MSQPVATPDSFESASKLEELAGLVSQIVRFSNELQAVSQCDFLADSASVCALLPVALSNAQSCLSLLQFIVQFIGQTPISSPYHSPSFNPPLPCSPPPPFVSPALNPPTHSPVPTHVIAGMLPP